MVMKKKKKRIIQAMVVHLLAVFSWQRNIDALQLDTCFGLVQKYIR